jgi:hypothetical protein
MSAVRLFNKARYSAGEPARDELDELKTAVNTAVEETSLASRPGKEDGS